MNRVWARMLFVLSKITLTFTVDALGRLREYVSLNFRNFLKPQTFWKSSLLVLVRYQHLYYCLQILFSPKECVCHIFVCDPILDAIFSLVILCSVMQNIVSPGIYLLSLCASLASTNFLFSTPKINLAISINVTKVIVWMKQLRDGLIRF